ncbi:MAG: ferritin [Chloroflexi bacterium]|nr:ferritin [Chloroflexota bacterium]
MGEKGRAIVKAHVQEIINDLQAAYADEWLAHYYFFLAADLAAGLNSDEVTQRLRVSAAGELEHANRLANRVVQLGGEPLRDVEQAPQRAHIKSFAMPSNGADIKGILRAAIEVERKAIETYQALVDRTRHLDTVTHELAEEILADEVAEEQALERLLAD